jgi:hypothetical protein
MSSSKITDLLVMCGGCPCAGNTDLQLPNWHQLKNLLRTNGPRNLTTLLLPYNGFQGPIGPLAYYLPQLRTLDLSGNSMHGFLPDLASEYPGQLQRLELADNDLQGKQGVCALACACHQLAATLYWPLLIVAALGMC